MTSTPKPEGVSTSPAPPQWFTFTFTVKETLSISLRALLRDGEPWFIARDVANALDYSDAYEMTKRLDDDQRQNLQLAGFGNRGVAVISESGLFQAIFGSNKPEAKAFRRWITDEVLPTIRKQGAYIQGADKLGREDQDALYVGTRRLLGEAVRRYDKETEHVHWRSLSQQREWCRVSAEKVSREMGLPVEVVLSAGSYGVDDGMEMLVKVSR
ncbi:MAG: hypothetical protein KKC85_04885 [Gammaproteobacteria bacterium]|nr:hypothetical protein [Gammaproteobacteria bacterium]MBU1530535.1 hypothetical protein [Gammaproteobacteria bacterium]MBU2285752.1 hypothetical protein [Gammaproteobacteria bacterium]